jgi:ADP-L-glycero-D-manno-heptose 6-epimerase
MWVQNNMSIFSAPIVGFRYFNVYGNDEEKEDYCTSPVYRFSQQAKNEGVIRIFEGSENTFRDFVSVNDVVNIITSDYYQSGIYDVGTSQPISFLDVAILVSKKYNVPIKFIPFPDILKDKYQYYTRAQDHFIGYNFISVEDYVRTSGV